VDDEAGVEQGVRLDGRIASHADAAVAGIIDLVPGDDRVGAHVDRGEGAPRQAYDRIALQPDAAIFDRIGSGVQSGRPGPALDLVDPGYRIDSCPRNQVALDASVAGGRCIDSDIAHIVHGDVPDRHVVAIADYDAVDGAARCDIPDDDVRSARSVHRAFAEAHRHPVARRTAVGQPDV